MDGQMSIFDFLEPKPSQMPMKEYLTKMGYKNEYFERPDHECIVEVVDIHEYPNLHYYEAKYVNSFGNIVQEYPQKCGYECHWWKEIRPIIYCQFSEHECNKTELWKVADSLDEIMCPRVCCRKCSIKDCGARCNGAEMQATILNDLPHFCHPDDNWQSIKTKPIGMDERLQLEILGKYRYNNTDCWSMCPAHIEGNEIIADNVPFDIPRPEWMFWRVKRVQVDIVGICDDAVCPICGHEFLYPKENDMEICPGCGQRMDWTRWHNINDNEEKRPDE